jgi:para-aminobenzoate synthetase/4-amino-4-deoxychorismate lyase
VQVTDPYFIERYQALHQMTSTVSGKLRPEATFYDIFASLFPCGSITGAPKIRTMQIIRDLERLPRGAYCGAIGFFAPDASAMFNVAIRTLVVRNSVARLGVGGGIVADSNARDEYNECLLKASFLTRRREEFELLETLLWDRDYHHLDYHLDRLQSSANYFGFQFDRILLHRHLQQLSAGCQAGKSYRVRLALHASGRITLQSAELGHRTNHGIVRLAAERISSEDVFKRHKTTVRDTYDRLHAEAVAEGFDDVLFMNERDEVTEGAISNLFIEIGGLWLTPPVRCGLLPGVFRRHLLESRPNTQERILRMEDIENADVLYLCNSLRGLRRVYLQGDRGL